MKRILILTVLVFNTMTLCALLVGQKQQLPMMSVGVSTALIAMLMALPIPITMTTVFRRRVPKHLAVSVVGEDHLSSCFGWLLLLSGLLGGELMIEDMGGGDDDGEGMDAEEEDDNFDEAEEDDHNKDHGESSDSEGDDAQADAKALNVLGLGIAAGAVAATGDDNFLTKERRRPKRRVKNQQRESSKSTTKKDAGSAEEGPDAVGKFAILNSKKFSINELESKNLVPASDDETSSDEEGVQAEAAAIEQEIASRFMYNDGLAAAKPHAATGTVQRSKTSSFARKRLSLHPRKEGTLQQKGASESPTRLRSIITKRDLVRSNSTRQKEDSSSRPAGEIVQGTGLAGAKIALSRPGTSASPRHLHEQKQDLSASVVSDEVLLGSGHTSVSGKIDINLESQRFSLPGFVNSGDQGGDESELSTNVSDANTPSNQNLLSSARRSFNLGGQEDTAFDDNRKHRQQERKRKAFTKRTTNMVFTSTKSKIGRNTTFFGTRASEEEEPEDNHTWTKWDRIGFALGVTIIIGCCFITSVLSWKMKFNPKVWLQSTFTSFGQDFAFRILQIFILEALCFLPLAWCCCGTNGAEKRSNEDVYLFTAGYVGFSYKNLIVMNVDAGSQAEQQGVKRGMQIYEIDDAPVKDDKEGSHALFVAHRTRQLFTMRIRKINLLRS